MAGQERIFQLQTLSGEPVLANGVTVTPQSQALTIRLPFWSFVYNRPSAILVGSEGRTERIPIIDVTRVAELTLALFVILLALAARSVNRRKELEDGR